MSTSEHIYFKLNSLDEFSNNNNNNKTTGTLLTSKSASVKQ